MEEYIPGAAQREQKTPYRSWPRQILSCETEGQPAANNNSRRLDKRTWCDLHFYRQDDELILVGGIGSDSDESCVVIHISGWEAGSHYPFCFEWRNFLEGGKVQYESLHLDSRVPLSIFKSSINTIHTLEQQKLTHNFPVPPCWPVGSSRCRSPPLEYISTTWSRPRKKQHVNSIHQNQHQTCNKLTVHIALNYLQWFTVWVVDVY